MAGAKAARNTPPPLILHSSLRHPDDVADYLKAHHYLGAARRGIAWSDEFGVIVIANPTSRRLPQDGSWFELVRWCLVGQRNAGSRQWSVIAKWLLSAYPALTTVVSYSDPSAGHSGALYKACGWIHAPTWHRLRPPPTGNGTWSDGDKESVKDRWVYLLRRDDRREGLLAVNDEALRRKGLVGYQEPKRWWKQARKVAS